MLPIAVKGIKPRLKSVSKKGKKSFDLSIDLELPDLAYGFPAGRIGGIFAAELRDRIVDHWSNGRTATGAKRAYTDKMKRNRATNRRIVEYASGIKSESRDGNKGWQQLKASKRKQYSRAAIVPSEIAGVRFKQRIKALYIPEPENGHAISDSGLMLDSLTLSLVRPRTQGGIVTSTWIRVRTAKIRQEAAQYVGGINGQAVSAMTSMVQTDSGWFPRTRFAIQNALDWIDRKQQAAYNARVNRVFNVIRTVTRGVSRYVAR